MELWKYYILMYTPRDVVLKHIRFSCMIVMSNFYTVRYIILFYFLCGFITSEFALIKNTSFKIIQIILDIVLALLYKNIC